MKLTIRKTAAIAALAVGTGAAHAAVCTLSDATYSVNGPNAGPFVNAAACAIFNPQQGQNIAPSDINGLWGSLFGGGTFVEAVKDENAGTATGSPVTLFGGSFTFSLQAIDLQATEGTYLLTATDNTVGTPNFPIDLDFALGLKGGSGAVSAYLFNDVEFDGSGGGAWKVTFTTTNMGNGNTTTPALSNLSVFVREGEGGGSPPFNVPTPGTLALLAIGLIGAAVAGRRKL